MSELVKYVDVTDALKRIGGSMDLYKRLLTQFSSGDYIEPLSEALSTGTFEEASRTIHSLKGVCANLSLTKLANAAADFEKLVHDGAEYSDYFVELKMIYAETVKQISEILQ